MENAWGADLGDRRFIGIPAREQRGIGNQRENRPRLLAGTRKRREIEMRQVRAARDAARRDARRTLAECGPSRIRLTEPGVGNNNRVGAVAAWDLHPQEIAPARQITDRVPLDGELARGIDQALEWNQVECSIGRDEEPRRIPELGANRFDTWASTARARRDTSWRCGSGSAHEAHRSRHRLAPSDRDPARAPRSADDVDGVMRKSVRHVVAGCCRIEGAIHGGPPTPHQRVSPPGRIPTSRYGIRPKLQVMVADRRLDLFLSSLEILHFLLLFSRHPSRWPIQHARSNLRGGPLQLVQQFLIRRRRAAALDRREHVCHGIQDTPLPLQDDERRQCARVGRVQRAIEIERIVRSVRPDADATKASFCRSEPTAAFKASCFSNAASERC